MPEESKPLVTDAWPVTWAAHRDDQLDRMLAVTPALRLAWLEEMIRVAFLAGALPRRESERGQPNA